MNYHYQQDLQTSAFNGAEEVSLQNIPSSFESLAEFEEASDKLRVYSIIRGDLEMTPGKLASQACHGAKNCVLLAQKYAPDLLQTYQGLEFIGTQIILKAKNEAAILRAFEEAKAAGLICSLIVDKHHVMLPHFTGDPIITGLGIGPCTREQAHPITKRFGVVQ